MFGSRQKLKYLVSFSSVDCYDSNVSCYCLLRTKFVHLKVKKARFAKINKEKRLCLEYYLAITNTIIKPYLEYTGNSLLYFGSETFV